jgi:cytosine/adenosine deaminase-related metal-dependent hydrolase
MKRWIKRLGIGLAAVLAALALAGVAFHRGLAGPEPLAASPRSDVILEDVVLVEPGVGRRAHRRIVVENGGIARVTGTKLRGGRWSGTFVLPGLVDHHVHFPPLYMPGQVELFSFLFLRHGVTGVRSLGDVVPGSSLRARAGEREGRFAGPRVATCGRFVDGDPPLFANAVVTRSPEEARAVVEALAAEGYDCIKVYNQLDAATLAAVRDAAGTRGLPVVGHVPFRVPFEEARLDDSQHLLGFVPLDGPPGFPPEAEGWLTLSDERIDAIVESVLADLAAMTPTLAPIDRMPRARELLADARDPVHLLLPPWYAHGLWALDRMNPAGRMSSEEVARVATVLERQQYVIRRLHEAGVRLRTGTDTLAPMVVPGAALHHELRLLTRAGLSPEEVLALATGSASEVFDLPGLGTLRQGTPADFVIYRDDPTRDLAALDSILAVVQDGRFYERAALDEQQARYRASFDGFFQRRIASPVVHASLGLALRRAAGIHRPPGASGAAP